MSVVIRLLMPDDAEAFFEIRRAALENEPMAFGSTPENNRVSSVALAREFLGRAPDSVVIGAFADTLIGSIGMNRQGSVKRAHKITVWGMYVTPQARQRGTGRALLEAGIAHAEALKGVGQIHLGVSEAAGAARRLYERCGFTIWGTEPDALRHDGESAAVHHMVLKLNSAVS